MLDIPVINQLEQEKLPIQSQISHQYSNIDHYLLENRIIHITDDIDDAMANKIIAQLLYFDAIDSNKDIQIFINSNGGSAVSGLAIYDTMQAVNCHVNTYCIGKALSMGAILLSTGHKRFALSNSKIMMHDMQYGGTRGYAIDVKIEQEEAVKTREKVYIIFSKSTNQTVSKIKKDAERNFYLSAEKALEYGIIDFIISKQIVKKEDIISNGLFTANINYQKKGFLESGTNVESYDFDKINIDNLFKKIIEFLKIKTDDRKD